jgi:hypothetical protein
VEDVSTADVELPDGTVVRVTTGRAVTEADMAELGRMVRERFGTAAPRVDDDVTRR